ncbi:MAG: alanine/glycine:cation symporter family protein [Oscillospiraceae bacterium]
MDADRIIESISQAIWGYPVLILMLGGGIYLTLKLKFPQLHFKSNLKNARQSLCHKDGKSDSLTQRQGIATALAATVGTGSITGVGTAIAIGGAGAIFWMWVSAFFGMALSYAENVLGVEYCQKTGIAGAMAYMEKGLHSKWLAVLFALFCALASLGMGNMSQSNSIAAACESQFNIPPKICGAIITLIITFIMLGKKRAAKCTEKLVPIMALLYILGSLAVIIRFHSRLGNAFSEIFSSAFGLKAAAGGGIGFAVKQAVVTGLRRGVFSNEAGLGSTVAIHSSCQMKSPEVQGCWGMIEVFIDTMVICTLTALVLLVSGTDIKDGGSDIICNAFSNGLGSIGGIFIAISVILFAFATIVGWFFIGERAWHYIFPQSSFFYKWLFALCVFIGSFASLETVWGISDIFNGLMALPNLTAVLMLYAKRQHSTNVVKSNINVGSDKSKVHLYQPD